MKTALPGFQVGATVYFVRKQGDYRTVIGCRVHYIEWFENSLKHWYRYHLDGWTGEFTEDQLFLTAEGAAQWIANNP